jgi:hypothetical protein
MHYSSESITSHLNPKHFPIQLLTLSFFFSTEQSKSRGGSSSADPRPSWPVAATEGRAPITRPARPHDNPRLGPAWPIASWPRCPRLERWQPGGGATPRRGRSPRTAERHRTTMAYPQLGCSHAGAGRSGLTACARGGGGPSRAVVTPGDATAASTRRGHHGG